jgi:cytochrome c oxidase assembly factor CtaG
VAASATSWQPAWEEVAVTFVLGAAYVAAARRHPPGGFRAAAFAAAVLLLVLVSVTPLATIALEYLLAAHLLQNVVMAEWAPALAVAGLGAGMAVGLARVRAIRVATHPLVALPAWLATYGVWHVPVVYDYALRNDLVLHLEHATYFVAGALLWWPVFQDEPWNLSAGAKAVYLFAAFVLASPIGLLLALLPEPVYDFYVEAPRLWGLTPLEDQQIAGVIMTVSEAVVFFAVFAFFFVRFMAEEEAGYSHRRA